jgi:alcohol dehydrogenase YqhD (iron-dependent ADH family)
MKKSRPQSSLPVGTILTLSATGTEMNPNSVITKPETKEKLNITNDLLFPQFSILDPTYTYSVSKKQTVLGGIDMMSHVFEQYFSFPNTENLSDNLCECVIKTIIANLNIAIENPENYNARANLMWCGTLAWNRLIGSGKEQDWMTHVIENFISGIYDISHGEGISILFPAWMQYVYLNAVERFKKYAINVWGIETSKRSDQEVALEGISKTKSYFKSLGAPTSFQEVGISIEDDMEKVVNKINTKDRGSFKKIHREDVEKILKLAR